MRNAAESSRDSSSELSSDCSTAFTVRSARVYCLARCPAVADEEHDNQEHDETTIGRKSDDRRRRQQMRATRRATSVNSSVAIISSAVPMSKTGVRDGRVRRVLETNSNSNACMARKPAKRLACPVISPIGRFVRRLPVVSPSRRPCTDNAQADDGNAENQEPELLTIPDQPAAENEQRKRKQPVLDHHQQRPGGCGRANHACAPPGRERLRSK